MTDHWEYPSPFADLCPHAGVGKACKPCREQHAAQALTAALQEVLAEVARIKRDANAAWTEYNECADAGDVDAANVHGAVGESLDEIAARLRRAIHEHIDVTALDLTDTRGPRA